MQPGPYPRNTHFDAEASRRAAERIVRENRIRAMHFALTGTAPAPDDVVAELAAADAAISDLQAALTVSLREVAR